MEDVTSSAVVLVCFVARAGQEHVRTPIYELKFEEKAARTSAYIYLKTSILPGHRKQMILL